MTKNYFLFARQINRLHKQLAGLEILSIYTENKDELIVLLDGNDEPIRLLIGINTSHAYLLLKKGESKRRQRYNFFPSLIGKQIDKLICVTGNKHLIISIGDHELHAVFYGSGANTYLTSIDTENPEFFKSSRSTAVQSEAVELQKPDQNFLNDLINAANELPYISFLKSKCPALNRLMLKEILQRSSLSQNAIIADSDNPRHLFEVFRNFYNELLMGPAYLYKGPQNELFLTLFKSDYLQNKGFDGETFEDINKAWAIYLSKVLYNRQFATLSGKINAALQKARHKLELTLEKIQDAEDINKHKRIADLKGNLLLTNLHKIKRGSKFVELKNIIDGNNEAIYIKLNPAKSIAENANIYFKKYKNKNEKLDILELKKNMYVQELAEIGELEKKSKTSAIKSLQKIEDKLIAMHLLVRGNNSSVERDELKFSFKRLIIEGHWDIFMGKNSHNNDLLTFSFAHKWDIWLHAQGVSGSHVIIRRASKNADVPPQVLEKAARITAANSKARHSATVPVIYTEARFVTRIRKALPGTVNVRNEKVIFVKPLDLNT